MRAMKTNNLVRQLLQVTAVAAVSLLGSTVQAAAPGITGTSFALNAEAAFVTQPDGASVRDDGTDRRHT